MSIGLVECYQDGKTEILEGKKLQVLLCPPHLAWTGQTSNWGHDIGRPGTNHLSYFED